MKKLAAHFGKAKQVVVERYDNGMAMVTDSYMAIELEQHLLPEVLAKVPDVLLATASAQRVDKRFGQLSVDANPLALRELLRRRMPDEDAWVTGLILSKDGEQLRAIMSNYQIVWASEQYIKLFGLAEGRDVLIDSASTAFTVTGPVSGILTAFIMPARPVPGSTDDVQRVAQLLNAPAAVPA